MKCPRAAVKQKPFEKNSNVPDEKQNNKNEEKKFVMLKRKVMTDLEPLRKFMLDFSCDRTCTHERTFPLSDSGLKLIYA